MANFYEIIDILKLRYARGFILIILLGIPLIVSDFYLYYVDLTLIYAILTTGLNIVLGITKLINFGFASFFGIGAYATGASMMLFNLPYLPSLLFGGIVSSFVGLLLAVPGVRLAEIGFALLTFAFGEAIVTVIGHIKFLGAYNGLMFPSVSIGLLDLKGNFRLFYLYYPIALALFIIYINVMKSIIGRAFIALADRPVAAQSMGVNVNRYQVLSIVLSSFYAGIAGGLFGPLVTFIDPGSFDIMQTILIFMMLIIGGTGTSIGPIIGAGLLIFMPEILREFSEYQNLIYGIILLVFIIVMPEGIWGRILVWQSGRFQRKR